MISTGILNFLPLLVFSILGGASTVIGFTLFTSVHSGVVWGVRIKAPAAALVNNIIAIVCLLFAGYSSVALIIGGIQLLFSGEFVWMAVNFAALVVSIFITSRILVTVMQKSVAKRKNAMCLEQFPVFKEIESRIDEASYFVVSFEGVALYSNTNYCFEVYFYENYQLGSLTRVDEVALVGTYFVQKYSDKFKFKVDMEVIPGEPGQTVVAVGTGGIGVARIKGTPDQHIFRSYIFTRK